MKKFLLSLLILPMLGFITSCDNDGDDLPEVDMEVAISGATQSPDNNKLYITQGTPLVVESITAVPRNGKRTTLGLTTYFLDGIPQYQTVTVPFGATFDTSVLAPGEYVFQIKTSVYQIDKSAAYVMMTYDLVVEEASADGTDTQADSNSFVATPRDTKVTAQQ